MTTVDIFEHPEKGSEAVKRGFSWPAAFSTVFWAFTKGLWRPGVMTFVLIVLIISVPGLAAFEQESFGHSGLGWFIGLLFGMKGNKWRRRRLRAQGWTCVATIECEVATHAIKIYRGGKEAIREDQPSSQSE